MDVSTFAALPHLSCLLLHAPQQKVAGIEREGRKQHSHYWKTDVSLPPIVDLVVVKSHNFPSDFPNFLKDLVVNLECIFQVEVNNKEFDASSISPPLLQEKTW